MNKKRINKIISYIGKFKRVKNPIIETDEAKLDLIEKYEGNIDKIIEVASTLNSADAKMQIINNMDISNIKKALDKILVTDDERIQAIRQMDDSYRIKWIAETIQSDENKLQVISEMENEYNKVEIARTIKTEEVLLKLFEDESLSANFYKELRYGYSSEAILKNIDKFTGKEYKGEQNPEKIKDVLTRMYEKNNDVVRTIDFKMLDERYLDLFGEDKINIISCYPEIQRSLLEMNDKQIEILCKCIDTYTEKNDTDEWNILASYIIKNINGFEKLTDSINVEELTQEDLESLIKILQTVNWLDIDNISDLRNYDELRIQKCEKYMGSPDLSLEYKKEAVIAKLFGHELSYAKTIIEKFGEDIENIEDSKYKDYVRSLKEIVELDDERVLQEIFDIGEYSIIDKSATERGLKTQYGEKYNEGLFQVPQNTDSNIHIVETDFKMIITAVGSYATQIGGSQDNYKDDWNRPVISTQHFCASYIRNDMIGTAPIRTICYGFSKIKGDALMVSGPYDLNSNDQQFVSGAERGEKYFTPDEQINHTEAVVLGNPVAYNEMGIRRTQNGEKITPDYIVVFKRDGKVPNMEEAQKASEQWGGMPIVVVDVDKCREIEEKTVLEMLEEYKQNPSNEELKHKIVNRVNNNEKTGVFEPGTPEQRRYLNRLCSSVALEEPKVQEDDLEENYEKVTAQERNHEAERMKAIFAKIQELKKEGQDQDDER